ncbi:MAG: hypothetical protein ACK2UU_22330 [Anaerolineae bacterium]
MAPDFLDMVLEAARLALLFFIALFLPVMLQLAILFGVAWAFRGLVYRVSSNLATLLDLIGVPIHELSHALGFLITLTGVDAIKLLIDELGYAFVAPKRPNPLGGIVASLAPLFAGTLVLWLAAIYIIPGFEVPYIEPPQLDLASAASVGTVLRESVDYLGRFARTAYEGLPGLQWDNWRTYAGLYIAFSVGLGIAPSSQDLRIFLTALPVAALLIVGVFTLLYLDGNVETKFAAWQQALAPLLLKFSTAVTYAFVLTSVAIPIFLVVRLFQVVREEE